MDERTFTRTSVAQKRHRLTCFNRETQILQHRLSWFIAEGNVVKSDMAGNGWLLEIF